MERKDAIDLSGAAMLISFSLLLGFNQVVVKVSTDGFQPVFMAGIRSVFGAGVLWLWMLWRGIPVRIPRETLSPAIWLGLFFGFEFLFLFKALDLTTVARASILFYSMPIWTALAAHFLIPGEALSTRRMIGLGLAIAGVALAVTDKVSAAQANLLGDLFALIGAFGWAAIALSVRVTKAATLKPEQQLFWQLIVSAPILMLAAPFFGPFIREPELIHYVGLVFQSVAVVSFGFVFWFWLMTKYPASGVASFSFLSPVFSVALGWLILNEAMGPALAGALFLVAVGLFLINRRRTAK